VSKKAWIIFAAVCAVVLGGLVYLSSKNKIDVSNVNVNKIQPASQQSGNIADHVFGKTDSKVMLIEYGDYQCPGCGAAYPNLKQVSEKYKDQLTFVFRNFPLSSLHPNARAAAAVAEAAGLQGKFWEMHNLLYENQSNWENLASDKRTDFFTDYAKRLGLDTNRFTADVSSSDINTKIGYDQALGKKINVDATPSIFLNGKTVDQNTWNNAGNLDKAVADALKEAGIELPK
jgi:protein-disulfide isomerase